MSSFLIKNIKPLKTDLLTGNYLVVLGVGKIPPHIALLSNGFLHSLKVIGYKKEKISDLLEIYKRKELACLFFELDTFIENVESSFSAYIKATKNVSCLLPIKDCLKQINTQSVNYVFDLIEKLEQQKAIKNVYQINLDNQIDAGVYEFKKYVLEDINNRIARLQETL